MPFINGRYHVNPAMGQALEAAREAEAALLALQRQARKNSADASTNAPADDSADPDDPSSEDAAADAETGAGPIHHVEIEVTQEGLPGRRNDRAPEASARGAREIIEPGRSGLIPAHSGRATPGFVTRVHRSAPSSMDRPAPPPEIHIFSDHGDLVNFLRDALAKDSAQRLPAPFLRRGTACRARQTNLATSCHLSCRHDPQTRHQHLLRRTIAHIGNHRNAAPGTACRAPTKPFHIFHRSGARPYNFAFDASPV